MTFLPGNFCGTRILRVGEVGVSPAVYSPAGNMLVGATAGMAVLLFL